MQTPWQRLTQWAATCPLDITFNPGATEADIAAAAPVSRLHSRDQRDDPA